MAITKAKKDHIVSEINELLKTSKLTVMANYSGSSVKALQELRSKAKQDGTTIKVIKNRLFRNVLAQDPRFKDQDLSFLNSMLIYAFNDQDELASAQSLKEFTKVNPNVSFVAGISSKGEIFSASDVEALASLPSKEQLRAQLAGTIKAPISSFVSVLNANLSGVINVLNARSKQLS